VFISGRGTVVTGRVERGIVKVGEEIEIVGIADAKPSAPASVFQNCSTKVKQANVGILLRGTKRRRPARPSAVQARLHQATPSRARSMSCPKTKVAVTPFFNNYRPQFYFRTTDVTGAIELPEGKEMPGDNVSITVKLINPIAMEELALRHRRRPHRWCSVVAKIIA
jgi:elongation factor Tu